MEHCKVHYCYKEFWDKLYHLNLLKASPSIYLIDTTHSFYELTKTIMHSFSTFLTHWFTASLGVQKHTALILYVSIVFFQNIIYPHQVMWIKKEKPLDYFKFSFIFFLKEISFLNSVIYLIPTHHTYCHFPRVLTSTFSNVQQLHCREITGFWGGSLSSF